MDKAGRINSIAEFNTLISSNLPQMLLIAIKIRWIFISTISVYGDLNSRFTVPLTQSPKPTDSYGVGKLHDEGLFISKLQPLKYSPSDAGL